MHVIYGYLQIGEIYNGCDILPEFCKYHPHARDYYKAKKNNFIYVANPKLTINPMFNGASFFNFSENLILTKMGMTRSKWNLPDFFKELVISYHNKLSFKDNYFQSAAKGQEFVIEASDELLVWILNLFL